MAMKGSTIEEMSEGFDVFDLKHTTDIKNSRDHTVLFHIPLPSDPNEHPVPQKGSDVWDGNHVRLPCANENTYREVDEDGKNQTRPRWDLIQQSLLTPMKNSYDLENAIKSYNTKYKNIWNFVALHDLMENEFLEEESKNFIEEVLPSMVLLALKLPHLIQTRIPLLKQGRNSSISLSQEQVACLLANAFFCTFPRRNSTKFNSEYSSYPDINFNRLFSSGGENVVHKIKCICTYFRHVCKVKMPTGVVTFQRRYVFPNNLPNWSECDMKFSTIKLHVSSTGRIENEGTGMLQVDFANKFLGGGVLGHGCVQEEIRFVICPELIVGRLFVESLRSAEAVLMVGCEQYCNYKGYAQTFEWNGSYKDTTPRDEFRRKLCSIVAIDALQFQSYNEQYKENLMRRELNKAYIGFLNDLPTIGPCVASGNWGCGAFGGISSLKALLQLMACVICKRNLSYFTFGDDHLRDKLLEVFKFLTDKKITVSQLWENLREFHYHGKTDEPDLLFPFIYEQYEKQNNRMFSKNDNSDQNAATTMRDRTESESSDKSGPRFILPGTPNSPPKILSLDEVQDVVKNIQNMALAHEIAVNTDFKLQPYEPPETSIEKMIKETMHKAFWNLLRQQLSEDPPCYDHAIQLLADIKECFQSIFLENNKKVMLHINETLDEALIRQQAEQGVLDFRGYANFVIKIMSLACAPIRDDAIAKLKEQEDVVEIFRGILETLSLMKLDMANCLLNAARNEVIANSVEYEKQKFKEYLEYYKDGFPATEAWLKRNFPVETPSTTASSSIELVEPSSPDLQRKTKDTIFNSYMELLAWNADNEFPEFFQMDRDRILALQGRALRICACASTMAAASGIPVIGQSADVKKNLAKEIEILLQNVNNNKELEEAMENIWVQIKSVIVKRAEELHQNPLDEQSENNIKAHITGISKFESPVRALMWKRLITYVQLILRSNAGVPPPPGYVDFVDELEALGSAFKRVTYYNYAVYGEYYHDILNKIRSE
ncbi:unnamed protein product [Diamesa hyperborea]